MAESEPDGPPVTLVTGARKGLGRDMVEFFLEAGHKVVGCSRAASDLEHPNYRHFEADVASESDVKPIFTFLRKEWGGLHNLVNNAGIASMNHALLTPMSSFDAIFSTNVRGTFLFCREAAKLMQRKQYGRIVNLTTVATPLRLEGESVYAASKAAVTSLTEILAREFADFGITVNAVAPTPVPTDIIRAVPKAQMQAVLDRQAIRRYGTSQDVIHAVNFFLMPQSGFITAQSLYLGGVV